MAFRVGGALQTPTWDDAASKKSWDYDESKMWHCIEDKANYATVVPDSYPTGQDYPSASTSAGMDAYDSTGSVAMLMRELRFSFPEGSSGFSDYAAYPWVQVFSVFRFL